MAGKKKKKIVRKKKVKRTSPKRRAKKSRKPPVRTRASYNTKGFKKYRAIIAAIKNYYTDSGKPISNAQALKIYHEVKGQFKDVQIRYLENAVESYLTGKEHKKFPDSCLIFSWFHIKDALTDHEAAGYFKSTDIISLDLSQVGLENYEFNYNPDLSKEYSELYATLKQIIKKSSPPPVFKYIEEKDSVYIWELEISDVEAMEEAAQEPSSITPPEVPTNDNEAERLRLQIQLEKEKQKTADKILELVKAGFSKNEAMKIMGIK